MILHGPDGQPVANGEAVLLPSAARAATTDSPQQTNHAARGVVLFLRVTAASGTGGLVVRIVGVDPATGQPVVLNPDPAAVTAVGVYAYELSPGASGGTAGPGRVNQRTSGALPRAWYAQVLHGDATGYSYSLAAATVL